MASEIGTNTFKVDKKARVINLAKDNRIPVRVRCANCGSRAYIIVPTYQLFAYMPGDPRILKKGLDREEQWENWCLQCIRAGYIEDDMGRTSISVNT
jgi:hypothetical protein